MQVIPTNCNCQEEEYSDDEANEVEANAAVSITDSNKEPESAQVSVEPEKEKANSGEEDKEKSTSKDVDKKGNEEAIPTVTDKVCLSVCLNQCMHVLFRTYRPALLMQPAEETNTESTNEEEPMKVPVEQEPKKESLPLRYEVPHSNSILLNDSNTHHHSPNFKMCMVISHPN